MNNNFNQFGLPINNLPMQSANPFGVNGNNLYMPPTKPMGYDSVSFGNQQEFIEHKASYIVNTVTDLYDLIISF